jgi:hypothetical protein
VLRSDDGGLRSRGQRLLRRGQTRRLRGVSFEWREDLQPGQSANDLGVIAQEVEQVFPELVGVDQRGYKAVSYIGLIAPLIEAVKELDARITELENARAARDP